ncbi:hypothetical protein C8J56DRAFT_899791 [Mycena floridula]|nr:hypothetical protein C8J56DRAFT_899791 [Mycena floridula]
MYNKSSYLEISQCTGILFKGCQSGVEFKLASGTVGFNLAFMHLKITTFNLHSPDNTFSGINNRSRHCWSTSVEPRIKRGESGHSSVLSEGRRSPPGAVCLNTSRMDVTLCQRFSQSCNQNTHKRCAGPPWDQGCRWESKWGGKLRWKELRVLFRHCRLRALNKDKKELEQHVLHGHELSKGLDNYRLTWPDPQINRPEESLWLNVWISLEE